MSDAAEDAALLKMWEGEAAFYLPEIARVLETTFAGRSSLRCLEIGCGPGLLLHKLQQRFPSHTFEGIEPVGEGFAKTDAPQQRLAARLGVSITRSAYEAFQAAEPYDLIFSVNVIEHVAAWRDYLVKTHSMLAPGGASLVLCPNYNFPLESHFILPIIGNKRVTRALFSGSIAKLERDLSYQGLWDGLNFIKRTEVTRFLKAQSLPFEFDDSIMERFFARLFTDPAFRRRFRFLAVVAQLAHRIGLTKVTALPGFRIFAPFMSLTVMRPRARS
jgi:2-polyprenyl-3-methyl-5-hydroxy-6-metoxy-1,4-benzoquinol methylase